MLKNIVASNGFAALALAINLGAQQPDPPLTKLRKLGLPEVSGSVPVVYVRSAEQRAIRLQKSLEAAHSIRWVEDPTTAPLRPESVVASGGYWQL